MVVASIQVVYNEPSQAKVAAVSDNSSSFLLLLIQKYISSCSSKFEYK